MTAESTVTVVVTREVPAERLLDAEKWMQNGQQVLSAFDGYLGAGWVRIPVETSERLEARFYFRSEEHLATWEHSAERARWVRGGESLATEREYRHLPGLNPWPGIADVDPTEPRVQPAPPRWKQMIVILTGFFPLSLAMNYGLLTVQQLPLIVRVVISVSVLTPVMTYLVIPFVSRRLSGWLTR